MERGSKSKILLPRLCYRAPTEIVSGKFVGTEIVDL